MKAQESYKARLTRKINAFPRHIGLHSATMEQQFKIAAIRAKAAAYAANNPAPRAMFLLG